MTDTTKDQATIITIVLPADGQDNPASIAVKQGDLGHVSTFAYDDFATICRALNTGLGGFNAVKANPPGDVESAQKTVNPTKSKKKDEPKPKKKDKPAGKPPYHLLNASGARRELMMMTDPFDVTDKCMNNKKMVFKELAEAEEIAQMLVDAGETRITIVFKNDKTAKVIGQGANETSDGDTSAPEPAIADTDKADETAYPDDIDNETRQALYDHLQDVDLTLAIDREVGKTKQYDWTNNLMKQRMVKGAIHKHVDDDKVEAIYDILFKIDHEPSETPSDEEVVPI